MKEYEKSLNQQKQESSWDLPSSQNVESNSTEIAKNTNTSLDDIYKQLASTNWQEPRWLQKQAKNESSSAILPTEQSDVNAIKVVKTKPTIEYDNGNKQKINIVPQKELQSNTSIVGTQAKEDNSYQVASIWDDAVHQAQKFLNQVEKLGEDFWETAKGGKQKVSDYGNAIGLSLQYIPQAIADKVDGILKEALAGLAISLIAAIGVVSLTTAIGGAIGSLGGGVGAVPGAAAGLRVGIFLLDKMGLMFLWAWIASGLTKVGVALGHFLAIVWDANGNSSAIDKGARQLADGMAQFIVLILEGIVAFAVTEGQGKALEMLGKSWFGKELGRKVGQAKLEQWLKQQLKARDAGEAITPDGQRMPIHGETPQRQQPMRMQGASGGNVIKNKLDQHEFAFAQEIVNEKGGQFIGQTQQNLPGIDGTLDGVPVSLKETQGGLVAILRHASKAETQAIKAGYKGVDLYINAPNVDKATLLDFIHNGPLKNIPNQGTISSINVKTSDGWIRIP